MPDFVERRRNRHKHPTLVFLQLAWPSAALALILQSVALTWLGKPEAVAAWAAVLPILSGIVTMMGIAAGGGPLIADQIRAKGPGKVDQ
jgi:hypothetical protein